MYLLVLTEVEEYNNSMSKALKQTNDGTSVGI